MYANNLLKRIVSSTLRKGKCLSNAINTETFAGYSAENLANRAIIKVSGKESYLFLQGLITNDMNSFNSGAKSIFTMFLNAKGRVIQDAIIYKSNTPDEFWIECDKTGADTLERHLKMYCLRRKMNIRKAINEVDIWAVYNPTLVNDIFLQKHSKESLQEDKGSENGIGNINISTPSNDVVVCRDPRMSVLGIRVLSPNGSSISQFLDDITLVDEKSLSMYKNCRYKLGVAEGLEEIPNSECFPLEMNCDYLNGVSFSKGCYIGQELTARTYHTGVIRKRLMPLILDSEPTKKLNFNTPISNKDEESKFPVGKLRGLQGNVGIGLMRIKEALNAKNLKINNINVRPLYPFWWPTETSEKSNSNT